mgnify:CR=1 FL=1
MPTRNNPRRPSAVGVAAALLLMGTALPTSAFDPAVEDEVRFQINCAILMLTDPVEHVAVCNPGPQSSPASLSQSISGGPGVVPPPPPPPPPPAPEVTEEEEEVEDPCPGGSVNPCGGCFYPN